MQYRQDIASPRFLHSIPALSKIDKTNTHRYSLDAFKLCVKVPYPAVRTPVPGRTYTKINLVITGAT